MKNILKACMNTKVLIGIGFVIVFAYLFIPQLARFSWILLALACPLSMMVMMAGMDHRHEKLDKLFVCSECDLAYREPELAKKCSAWCKEHNSCNLEITKHAVQ